MKVSYKTESIWEYAGIIRSVTKSDIVNGNSGLVHGTDSKNHYPYDYE